MTKKHELREFVIIPMVLIILMIFVYYIKDKITGPIGNIFFPLNDSIIEQTKYFFTPIVIVIIIEYLFSFEMPNNYLFSRVIGLVAMILLLTSFNLIYSVFSKDIVVMIFFPFYIIFIYASQVISYFLQKTVPIKMAFLVSFSMFVLLSFTISFLTFTLSAI